MQTKNMNFIYILSASLVLMGLSACSPLATQTISSGDRSGEGAKPTVNSTSALLAGTASTDPSINNGQSTSSGCPNCLNDTGIATFADLTNYNLQSEPITLSRQDASQGRDADALAGKLQKSGGGHAGFDFTKITNKGNAISQADAANASLGSGDGDWACTRDNVTGLVWEVKTATGPRGVDNTYTWFNSDRTTNEGHPGNADGGSCDKGSSYFNAVEGCSTEKYVNYINRIKLCGYDKWRLPGIKEIYNLTDFGQRTHLIDTDYFPNSPTSGSFWSGTFFKRSATVGSNNYFYLSIWSYHIDHIYGDWARASLSNTDINDQRPTETAASISLLKQSIRLVVDPSNQSLATKENKGCSYKMDANYPDGNYSDHGNGTVTHNTTNLMWSHCPVGMNWNGTICTGIVDPKNWTESLSMTASSTVAGYSDWRMPNIKEIFSLVEECRPPIHVQGQYQSGNILNMKHFPNQKGTQTTSNLWSSSFDWRGKVSTVVMEELRTHYDLDINACANQGPGCGGNGAATMLVRNVTAHDSSPTTTDTSTPLSQPSVQPVQPVDPVQPVQPAQPALPVPPPPVVQPPSNPQPQPNPQSTTATSKCGSAASESSLESPLAFANPISRDNPSTSICDQDNDLVDGEKINGRWQCKNNASCMKLSQGVWHWQCKGRGQTTAISCETHRCQTLKINQYCLRGNQVFPGYPYRALKFSLSADGTRSSSHEVSYSTGAPDFDAAQTSESIQQGYDAFASAIGSALSASPAPLNQMTVSRGDTFSLYSDRPDLPVGHQILLKAPPGSFFFAKGQDENNKPNELSILAFGWTRIQNTASCNTEFTRMTCSPN